MLRTCSMCAKTLPVREFHSLQGCYCKPCRRAQMRKRYQDKREAIDALKLARGCADCGYCAHPRALQFDHLPGNVKGFAISAGVISKRSLDDLLAEAALCEVVCANCHAVRTATRQEPSLSVFVLSKRHLISAANTSPFAEAMRACAAATNAVALARRAGNPAEITRTLEDERRAQYAAAILGAQAAGL